jgi:hypothetical protein
MARPLLASGGRAIAMRSVGESPAGEPIGAREVLYELPDGTPRRLLVFAADSADGGPFIRPRNPRNPL